MKSKLLKGAIVLVALGGLALAWYFYGGTGFSVVGLLGGLLFGAAGRNSGGRSDLGTDQDRDRRISERQREADDQLKRTDTNLDRLEKRQGEAQDSIRQSNERLQRIKDLLRRAEGKD